MEAISAKLESSALCASEYLAYCLGEASKHQLSSTYCESKPVESSQQECTSRPGQTIARLSACSRHTSMWSTLLTFVQVTALLIMEQIAAQPPACKFLASPNMVVALVQLLCTSSNLQATRRAAALLVAVSRQQNIVQALEHTGGLRQLLSLLTPRGGSNHVSKTSCICCNV